MKARKQNFLWIAVNEPTLPLGRGLPLRKPRRTLSVIRETLFKEIQVSCALRMGFTHSSIIKQFPYYLAHSCLVVSLVSGLMLLILKNLKLT